MEGGTGKIKMTLFGSRARGEARYDSDVDVVVLNKDDDAPEFERLVEKLKPYALEFGGNLDLFIDEGDQFTSVYDHYIYRGSSGCKALLLDIDVFDGVNENDVRKEMKPIIMEELMPMLRKINK